MKVVVELNNGQAIVKDGFDLIAYGYMFIQLQEPITKLNYPKSVFLINYYTPH